LFAATPGQQDLNDALRLLSEVAARLTAPGPVGPTDVGTQLEELKKSTTALGTATKEMIGVSRSNPGL
jgi:hypothetical protein